MKAQKVNYIMDVALYTWISDHSDNTKVLEMIISSTLSFNRYLVCAYGYMDTYNYIALTILVLPKYRVSSPSIYIILYLGVLPQTIAPLHNLEGMPLYNHIKTN